MLSVLLSDEEELVPWLLESGEVVLLLPPLLLSSPPVLEVVEGSGSLQPLQSHSSKLQLPVQLLEGAAAPSIFSLLSPHTVSQFDVWGRLPSMLGSQLSTPTCRWPSPQRATLQLTQLSLLSSLPSSHDSSAQS